MVLMFSFKILVRTNKWGGLRDGVEFSNLSFPSPIPGGRCANESDGRKNKTHEKFLIRKAINMVLETIARHDSSSGSETRNSNTNDMTDKNLHNYIEPSKMDSRNDRRGCRHSSRPRIASSRSSSHRERKDESIVKQYVHHNYHDHLNDPRITPRRKDSYASSSSTSGSTTGEVVEDEGGLHPLSIYYHRGGVTTPFPEKLHHMLNRMDVDGTNSIVSWQPHGRAFAVHKPKEFVQEIMPKFFRQSKMTSFQRQLNLYGFFRLTTGPDRGGYYNELFLRGRSDLCKAMVRTRVKGNGTKAAASPSTEPNFYEMESCPLDDEDGKEDASTLTTCPSVPCSSIGADNDPSLIVSAGHVTEEEMDTTTMNEDETPLPLESNDPDSEDRDFFDNDVDVFLLRPLLGEPNVEGVIDENAMVDVSSSRGVRTSLDYKPALTLSENFAAAWSTPNIVSPVEDRCDRIYSMGVKPQRLLTPNLKLSSSQVTPLSAGQRQMVVEEEQQQSSSISSHERESLHSGDEIFFEGLCFHYLETSDMDRTFINGVYPSTGHLMGA